MQIYKEAERHKEWLIKNCPYKMMHWSDFDFNILAEHIVSYKRNGRGRNDSVNDIIIGCDTETSKKPNSDHNHICAWTISIRAYNYNIVTLYGHKPSTMVMTMHLIYGSLKGDQTLFYFHNLQYDYQFLRRFLYLDFGYPMKQLNTKPHYPINIEFGNGVILKDSLILAQRSLEKWANDLDVPHKKARGKWDYSIIRNQNDPPFSSDELEYIENDTLALVECLDATCRMLRKKIFTLPFTATGIPREELRKIGKKHSARQNFIKKAMTFDQSVFAESVYHGGYSHSNRHIIDFTIKSDERGDIICYDFASSYPFALFCKFPCEPFKPYRDLSIDYILRNRENYAFMFTLILTKVRLKDDNIAMPVLQFSKCTNTINAITDNGRILYAEYVEIPITSEDLVIIAKQYDYDSHLCCDVQISALGYLPQWFTDYVWQLYTDKCKLKDGDPILYQIQKAKLNSIYGCCVQKPYKQNINEVYETGEYVEDHQDPQDLYNKYVNKINTILPYQWGVFCTAIALRRLYELGECIADNGIWLYSDTDSIYAIGWDQNKLKQFNDKTKQFMIDRGYGCVEYKNKKYWLGCAEQDKIFTEFRTLGCKRYCGRSKDDNQLHITIAGVPKQGVKCLNDDIENFTAGMIFDGKTTGKLTHTYIFVDDIYIDDFGNETGDSIDLNPCDYLLDRTNKVDFNWLFNEEVEVSYYG